MALAAISRTSCSRQLLCDPIRRPLIFATFWQVSRHHPSATFSSSTSQQSRIGSAAISVPPEISLRFIDLPRGQATSRKSAELTPVTAVEVSGPLGTMTLKIPPFSTLRYDPESRKAAFSIQNAEDKHQRAMWGTIRQHLRNYILGVSEGHTCILKMVGVGFRASIEPKAITIPTPEYPGQQFVSLKVGYAHPVELGIPQGVKALTPQPTSILLEGTNKEVITQFAADIRKWRPPEPYKGKGIFVDGETIKLKAKKIK
ncbi:hypothetical protein FQN57_000502 [Myotisia sp. PD_48]|nr:hypothetical protein FQN57_000502 [Myotisia sp. PD_48]